MSVDPRGPSRIIVAVETWSGPTIVTLSCGHRVERASHFSYRTGDMDRCFTCKKEGRS